MKNKLSFEAALLATVLTMFAIGCLSISYEAFQAGRVADRAVGVVLMFFGVLLLYGSLQTILWDVVKLTRGGQ